MAHPLWTIDELIARVVDALAHGYPGAPSARVRDLPDVRTVRWYVTRGLVDPPLAMRGRQALYGRRHLLQLVALKRRQAEGAPLSAIQAELAGLPDATLATIAALPPAALPPAAQSAAPPVPRPAPSTSQPTAAQPERVRFWTTAPAARAVGAVGPRPDKPVPAPPVTILPAAVEGTAEPRPGGGTPGLESPGQASAGPAVSAAGHRSGAGTEPGCGTEPQVRPEVERVHRIRLAAGVVLLVDDTATDTAHPLDAAALRAAATPLLDLLRHGPNGHGRNGHLTDDGQTVPLDHDRTHDHDATDDEGTRR